MMNPKVSVCVVTYNQEKYIEKCLTSLINQQVDFEYEIIVGEDCSTDSTRQIVERIAYENPGKISLISHKKNIGTIDNLLSVYRAAKGQYICHMDGDDLAYPDKLSCQVDALEKNIKCNICTHDVNLITHDDKMINRTFCRYQTGNHKLEDLLECLPFFAHSSKMFRNDLQKDFWGQLADMALDVEIHVQQTLDGDIFHIDKPLGAYRINTGVTSKGRALSNHLPDGITRLFNAVISVPGLDKNKTQKNYSRCFFAYAYQSALLGNGADARNYIRRSVHIKAYSFSQIIFLIFAYMGVATQASKIISKIKGY